MRLHASRRASLGFFILLSALLFPALSAADKPVSTPFPAQLQSADGTQEVLSVPIEHGTTYLDLVRAGLLPEPGALSGTGGRAVTTDDIDPGTSPEGDYMGWAVFTRDGQRLLLTNRGTDNVTVYDTATRQVLANIEVGSYPSGIAVSDDYAVVACSFSDEAYIINLSTYAVDAVIPTGEQPWVVRINPNGTQAFVACDIANTCEVIDLTTLALDYTIPDFPVYLVSFSWASENARNGVEFSSFEITPDGAYIMAGDGVDGGNIFFYDTATGSLAHTIPAIDRCVAFGFSGDQTKAVAVCTSYPTGAVHLLDLSIPAITQTVMITGYTISTRNAAVNQDGTKAFLGVSNNSSCFVDFTDGTFNILTSTYTPFALGASPDHTLALGIQFRFSVLDFASEALLGQYQGNSMSMGAVNPMGTQAIGYDPLRNEGVYFYDYSNTAAPAYLGQTVAGLDPEADCPRRVALTPDGSRALVSNVLSGNVTIMNLETYVPEANLYIGPRVQDVAVTPDGLWAVACGMESYDVKVLDLTTNSIAATVYTGARPAVVSITPDGSKAFVANIQANTISIIALAGASSYKITDIYCGVIGVKLLGFGVNSDCRVSPDGQYCLVTASFDDQVKVIDTSTNSIVATLTVGDFPWQVAFDSTGEYATVTNNSANTISVLHIDGALSSVLGTFTRGTGPLRLDYDAAGDRIGICHTETKTVTMTNPETGALISNLSTAAYGTPLQVRFASTGDPIILTSSNSYLLFGSDVLSLPSSPSYFDYAPASGRAVVTMPGPDWITVVNSDVTGVRDMVTVPLSGPGSLDTPWPNPSGEQTLLRFATSRAAQVEVILADVSGRVLKSFDSGILGMGSHEVTASVRDLAPGAYFAILRMDGRTVDSKRLVVAR